MMTRYVMKHLDVKGKIDRKREKRQPIPKKIKGERKCLTPIMHCAAKAK